MPVEDSRPLQVLPLGVGDSFSRLEFPCTMLLLGGRTACLLDCADPIHRMLHERAVRAGLAITAADIDHIVLTHLHGDHCNGLESLLFHRKFVSRSAPPTIHALPEVCEALWPRRLSVSMGHSSIPEIGLKQVFAPEDFFQAHPVEPGAPFEIGDLRFDIRRTRHSVPTFGFRVSCGGRTFGYSGDTTFDPEHIEFLSSADLIFHDCNESIIHTRYAELLTVAPETRDRMHIFHLADGATPDGSEIPLVESGRLYTV